MDDASGLTTRALRVVRTVCTGLQGYWMMSLAYAYPRKQSVPPWLLRTMSGRCG